MSFGIDLSINNKVKKDLENQIKRISKIPDRATEQLAKIAQKKSNEVIKTVNNLWNSTEDSYITNYPVTKKVNTTYGAGRKKLYLYINFKTTTRKLAWYEQISKDGERTVIKITPRADNVRQVLFVPKARHEKMFPHDADGDRPYVKGAIKGKHFSYLKYQWIETNPVLSIALREHGLDGGSNGLEKIMQEVKIFGTR